MARSVGVISVTMFADVTSCSEDNSILKGVEDYSLFFCLFFLNTEIILRFVAASEPRQNMLLPRRMDWKVCCLHLSIPELFLESWSGYCFYPCKGVGEGIYKTGYFWKMVKMRTETGNLLCPLPCRHF